MNRICEFSDCRDCPNNKYEPIQELPNGFIKGRYYCSITNDTLRTSDRGFPHNCPLPVSP